LAASNPITAVIAELSAIPGLRRTRRWMYFVDELLKSWDQEIEALWRAVSEERMSALLEHAQRVTESSRSDEKVRLAAKIVCDVLRGDASDEQIETANVLLDLIDPLEAHHLEVFAVLGTPSPEVTEEAPDRGWTTTDLQSRLPHLPASLVPVLVATLTSSGLAFDRSATSVTYGGLGPQRLGLTEAGAWLLQHLNEYEATPRPD
jgi:hypothetical protein